jgi:replicative DNA helicase
MSTTAQTVASPHNIEAEEAVLGAILVNNEAFYRVSDFLVPDHFYEPANRRTFEIISHLINDGRLATPVTLAQFDFNIEGLDVNQYLRRLAAGNCPGRC